MEDTSDLKNEHQETEVVREKENSGVLPKKNDQVILESLEKKLEEQKQIAKNNYEKFLRVYAELENYKKRAAKDKADFLKYANGNLLQDLLPFIDNLERAVEHVSLEHNNSTRGLVEGIRLILKDLMGVLKKYGLKPIEGVGKPFDPNIHEAVRMVQSESHEPNTVIEEFQRGYRLKDRLLRSARVSVAVKSETKKY